MVKHREVLPRSYTTRRDVIHNGAESVGQSIQNIEHSKDQRFSHRRTSSSNRPTAPNEEVRVGIVQGIERLHFGRDELIESAAMATMPPPIIYLLDYKYYERATGSRLFRHSLQTPALRHLGHMLDESLDGGT